MENPRSAVPVPLSTFGGLITELTPSDLPEGGSPDNQDVAFAPDGFQTRPGLSRVYPNPATTAAIVYEDTFTRKDGTVFNVFLDANGAVWGENFTNAPGLWTNFVNVPAGSLCNSAKANGRLYMTFFDGLRGTHIPMQWDGSNLDRVTMDGPGVGPSLSNYGVSASLMASTGGGSGSPVSISSCFSSDSVQIPQPHYADPLTYYTTVTFVTSSPHGFSAGQSIKLAGITWTGLGSDALPVYATVSAVLTTVSFKIRLTTRNSDTGSGGTATPTNTLGITAVRLGNVVTVNTQTAHGLTIGNYVAISGMSSNTIGGAISTAVRAANIATITTTGNHGLVPNAIVTIAGVSDTTFNGSEITVLAVTSATQFTYANNGADSSSTGGTVSDLWNGIFPVTVVQSPTQFSYSQIGADDSSSSIGTVTPTGQLTPGVHNCVVMFQTRTGFITAPSPPSSYTANGGQYLQITNIPIGPPNVVGRVLAFTMAGGSRYFYIPQTVTENGIVTAQGTVINDNTTTAVLLDISDDMLSGATGIDIAGNNLFNLRKLGRPSSVRYYADRTMWAGDDNQVINFVNMGFDGGANPTVNPDGSFNYDFITPAGWNSSGRTPSYVKPVVATSVPGWAYAIVSSGGAYDGLIWQSAYQDVNGAPILVGGERYSFRFLALCSVPNATGNLVIELHSPALPSNLYGFVITPLNQLSQSLSWVDSVMATMPAYLPPDLQLRIYVQNAAVGTTVYIDEVECYYTLRPYNDTQWECSYVVNPESIDGLTGNLGATADPTPIMDGARLRDNFYWVTGSTLQTTKDVAGAEPSSWDVNEMGAKCGCVSMRGMVVGESWLAWPCLDGARMYDGSNPIKITQEVQAKWDALSPAALQQMTSVNDSANRRIYWAVGKGTETAPQHVYVLDYRYADTAAEIEERGAIRVSPYNGRMLVLELSRKFTEWTIPASCVGTITTPNGVETTFADAQGRVYSLDETQFHDDDYGVIPWYYVTSPFVTDDMEQQMQLGNFRHLYTFLSMYYPQAVGTLTITPLVGNLLTAWPARGPYTLQAAPSASLELGLNVSGEKMFLKFSGAPLQGSQDSFISVSRMVVTMKPHPFTVVAV